MINLKKEAGRFEKAFRDPEFVKMFAEFVKEMQDPKTRALHEEELRQLAEQQSQENGPEAPELIVPNQGYCVKIKDDGSGSGKIFINICFHDRVQPVIGIIFSITRLILVAQREAKRAPSGISTTGKQPVGEHLQIPYVLAAPHIETDHGRELNLLFLIFLRAKAMYGV